jgi:hypothetical protein
MLPEAGTSSPRAGLRSESEKHNRWAAVSSGPLLVERSIPGPWLNDHKHALLADFVEKLLMNGAGP